MRQDSPMASAAKVLDVYDAWLDRQVLARGTRSAYRRWATELLEHLVAGDELDAFLALAAATSLLYSRALRSPDVRRVEVDPKEARALSREQLRALQCETDRLASSRDRAIVQLLMHARTRRVLRERTDALVTVDVDLDLLERAADARGPDASV